MLTYLFIGTDTPNVHRWLVGRGLSNISISRLVGCGLSTVSAVHQVLTGTLTLFQAARERRCHVQRSGIEPGWLNLEARNLPLDQNASHIYRPCQYPVECQPKPSRKVYKITLIKTLLPSRCSKRRRTK